MNILELRNDLSEFSLFLMGRFVLIYEYFGLQALFQNELFTNSNVPLNSIVQYTLNILVFGLADNAPQSMCKLSTFEFIL